MLEAQAVRDHEAPARPSAANSRPVAPPASASTMLSVSSCLTSRPRPAPNATRTANSFRRDSERDSSAPARFAQVITQHEPRARHQHEQRRPCVADHVVAQRSGDERHSALRLRMLARDVGADRCDLALGAVSIVLVGARRATTPSQCCFRALIGSRRAGAMIERQPEIAAPIGPTKPRGSTPTIS